MNKLTSELNRIPPASGAEDRMYQHILEKYQSSKAAPIRLTEDIPRAKHSPWKAIIPAAAVVLVAGGAAGAVGLSGMLNPNSQSQTSTTEATADSAETSETEEITIDVDKEYNRFAPNDSIQYRPVISVDTPNLTTCKSFDGGRLWSAGSDIRTLTEEKPAVYALTNVDDELENGIEAAATIFNNSGSDLEIKSCKLVYYNDGEVISYFQSETGRVIKSGDKKLFIMPFTELSKRGVYRFTVEFVSDYTVYVDFFVSGQREVIPIDYKGGEILSAELIESSRKPATMAADVSPYTPVDVKTARYYDEFIQYTEADPSVGTPTNSTMISTSEFYIGAEKGDYIGLVNWSIPPFYFDDVFTMPNPYYSELRYIRNGQYTETIAAFRSGISYLSPIGDKVYFTVYDEGIFELTISTGEIKNLVAGRDLYIYDICEDFIRFMDDQQEMEHTIATGETNKISSADGIISASEYPLKNNGYTVTYYTDPYNYYINTYTNFQAGAEEIYGEYDYRWDDRTILLTDNDSGREWLLSFAKEDIPDNSTISIMNIGRDDNLLYVTVNNVVYEIDIYSGSARSLDIESGLKQLLNDNEEFGRYQYNQQYDVIEFSYDVTENEGISPFYAAAKINNDIMKKEAQ